MNTPKTKKYLSSLFELYTYNIKDNLYARWGLFCSVIFTLIFFLSQYVHYHLSSIFSKTNILYWLIAFIPIIFYPIIGATGTFHKKEYLKTALQLRRSAIRYKTLVDNLPDIIYSSSPDNKFDIKFISNHIEDICGYKPEEFYSSPDTYKKILHPDDRDSILEKNERINHSVCFNYRIINKDTKKIHYVRDHSIPVTEGNKRIAIEGIIADITNEVKAKERLTALTREIINTQEKERQRIAKELHDEVGQALTAIKINLNLMEKELGPNSSIIKKTIKQTDQIADTLILDLKRISLDLRPSMLDDLGLKLTLEWYIKQFRDRTKIDVSYYASCLENRLPIDIETTLYRIIQEALTNIIKHSAASKVFINIKERDEKVYVYIADNGKGFSVEKAFNPETRGISFGIMGMQERVRNLGGDFKITSGEAKGTRVSLYIPMNFYDKNDLQ